jgi:hypothetical protein
MLNRVDTDQQTQTVICDACGRSVVLQVQAATAAEAVWRWFDCPFCRKPNFRRIAGQILKVAGNEQQS